MRKKLLPLAVAAAVSVPAAVLADATIYGSAHLSLDYFDITGTANDFNNLPFKGWAMNRGANGRGNTRESRFGIKGSEKLSNGLEAIYQVEFEMPLANESGYSIRDGEHGDAIKMRNSYVGLKSDLYGTALIGRHDTPYKMSTSQLELFNDTMADNEGTLGFDDFRADNTIAYISPTYYGFQFTGAIIPGSSSIYNGDSKNRQSDSLAQGYSFAAMYRNGPWYASAAYEVLDEEFSRYLSIKRQSDDVLANTNSSPEQIESATSHLDVLTQIQVDDYKKMRVGLGVRDINGFYVSAIFEKQESVGFRKKDNSKNNDADIMQAQVGYAFGNNMLKAMYGQRTMNAYNNRDHTSFAVGFDHFFSKRTKAYALYTNVDHDQDHNDWKGFSLGMVHSF